jgi:hypothetical protein
MRNFVFSFITIAGILSQTTGEQHPAGMLDRDVLKEKYKGIMGRVYS